MFKWLDRWLEHYDRKTVIMDRDDKNPYLVRYYIAWPDSVKRERRDIPFNVFIHQFMKSDDPVLHDHPWSYFTIILKGGYWEHTAKGKFWRGPGHMRFNKGDFHWIEIPEPGKTWTLFIRFKTRKSWGFLVPDYSDIGMSKYVDWEEYLEKHRK